MAPQLCMGFGPLVAIQVVVFRLLRFVGSILPSHSGRFIAASLLASCLPIGRASPSPTRSAVRFLNASATVQVRILISTDTNLSFVALYLAAFDVPLRSPLVLLIVNRLTPLRPRALLRQTRWGIVAGFVVAAVVNPTKDPVNQTLMAGPIILHFLLSVGVIWLVNRRGTLAPVLALGIEERLLDQSRAKLVASRATRPTARRACSTLRRNGDGGSSSGGSSPSQGRERALVRVHKGLGNSRTADDLTRKRQNLQDEGDRP